MDKYVSCSRCKYKVLFEYKALQKLAGVERLDFFDFVCSHCKKKILHKRDNINTPKHVVSYSNSIKTTPSALSIPPVKLYKRDDKHLNSSHSPTNKSEKLKRSESSDSKESVATYDTVKMQEELKTTGAGLKLKEGISKEQKNKYVLKQIRDNYEKQITRPGYALSEQEQENFRFWFPDKDLDKSEPIQYTKNRTSIEIIKDMFEKKGFKYNIKVKDPPNIVEPIGDGDWSTKIVKKYATENKLKCFDVKSFETFDRNKYRQIKTTDMDRKGQELDNAEESRKAQSKTITREKPKKQKSTQKREKALKSINDQRSIERSTKKTKDKKQTGDGDSGDRDGKKEKKKHKYSEPKQTFDETDTGRLKKGTLSKEDVREQYEQKSVTETKISVEDDKAGQKKKGEGEGDELVNARKSRIMEIKDKVLKKSKEEKGKVSKVGVRDPNIRNKKPSLLKDIVMRFKGKETSENLNPEEFKVSKIGLKDKKRGFKKEKKQVIFSDKTKIKDSYLDTLQGDQEVPKGTTRYALSDRRYIDKGWTKLPTEKTVRKMLLYKMKQSHPEFDWFNRNKHKKEMFYNTGEKLADFENEEDSKGDHLKKTKRDKTKKKNKLYYRNGKVALEHYVPEEENNEKRIVVYSNGEPDESGRPRPPTILATFDHLGNGVVYDYDGNVRLKYNQTEGVLLDKTVGPFTHWKWHTLNDPPELKDVMAETALVPKDMNIAKLAKPNEVKKVEDEEIQTIAMENFIKSKQKKFKPYPVKMKAVKINEYFSLKVIDQATMYLNFKDYPINIKTNIGMVLDQKDIVDTELAEIGDVSTSVEKVPPRTASLSALQSQRKYIQRLQRKRFEREILLRLKQPSIDRLYAGVSKPRRHKVITVKVDKACQCDLLCCYQFFCTT